MGQQESGAEVQATPFAMPKTMDPKRNLSQESRTPGVDPEQGWGAVGGGQEPAGREGCLRALRTH